MTCIWHNSDLGTRFDYKMFIEGDSCFFHSIFNTHGYITRLYMHCIVGILDLCASCHDHPLANKSFKAQLCSSMLINFFVIFINRKNDIRIRISIRTCTCTLSHICTRTSIRTCTSIYIRSSIHNPIHIWVRFHIRIHIKIRTHIRNNLSVNLAFTDQQTITHCRNSLA